MGISTRVLRHAGATVALSLLVTLLVPTTALAVTAADDNISGATYLDAVDTAGTASVSDTLDVATGDLDDVFVVWAEAGEMLEVNLAPPASSDWGLYIYDPFANDIWADDYFRGIKPAAQGGPGTTPLNLEFVAPESGPYYVNVSTDNTGGSGGYALTTTLTRRSTYVTLTSNPATLDYGAYPTVTGTVADRFGATPSGNVYFYYSFDGLRWTPLSGGAYSGGAFEFYGYNQWRKTYYLVTFEGGNAWTTSSQGTGAYATRSNVSNVASSKSTWGKSKRYTAYGYIEPQHTAGSYPVRIYKYKRVSGKWKSDGYVKAKASTIDDNTSKYSRSMSLPTAGRWRLRAVSPADSQHVKSYSSSYKDITVK